MNETRGTFADLPPTDDHFFLHLDHYLSDNKFNRQMELDNAFFVFINSKDGKCYSEGTEKCPTRWHKCIESSGDFLFKPPALFFD